MGAYLSEPLTDKASSDEANELVMCGLSSMQGWRMTQEDAHNSLLNFDEKASLFAVYDGHGGHEVAAYCAQHLPKFIRETEAYNKGDYVEALKQAFLDFDAALTAADVISVLKEIAGKDEEGSEDEENVSNLHEEASMPIEQLLAKYQSDANPALRKLPSADGKLPPSPYLKSHQSGKCSSGGAGCSSSSDGPSGSGAGSSAAPSAASSAVSSAASSAGCSSSSLSSSDLVSSSSTSDESQPCSSNDKCGDDVPDTQTASPDVGSSVDIKDKEKDKESPGIAPSSSSEGEIVKQNGDVDSTNKKKELNGDINHDLKEESDSTTKNDTVSSSSPSKEPVVENGEVASESPVRVKGKGKAKDKSPRPDPEAKEEVNQIFKNRFSHIQLYRRLLKNSAVFASNEDDSDETDDEDDTTFEGGDVDSDDEVDDGDEEGEEDDDEVEEDEEEEDEDDEEDSVDEEEEDEDEFGMKFTDEPGTDSGCTAVVALLKGKDLYVANAGDSRCVVCRGGKAIDMSLDHKPEDGPEMTRITKAGGKVTCDGRVNGGLNLSRAIGDHAYKQSKDLPATEQMITALPDVRTLRIDPEQDEFMVLACDGIWNFLSSQEVVDFVRTRLKEGKLKVSQICEELFDHCLAPNTLGDGTGCDNMTAVIVKFQSELAKAPSTLTHDSVFDIPISNDNKDKEKSEAEAAPETKPNSEESSEGESEGVSDEVSTSISLKRAAASDDPKEEDSGDSGHQDKRSKSSPEDSEAMAMQA